MSKYLKDLVLFLFLLIIDCKIQAQSHQSNTWYFGCGNTLQFTPNGPVPGIGIPKPPGDNLYDMHGSYRCGSIAVCNETGRLDFFVQIQISVQPSYALEYVNKAPKIFDRYGQPLKNSNIEANFSDGCNPVVVPHLGNGRQYYLFYTHNSALLYSLVDMNGNNGLGEVVPGQKDIKLTGYGEVTGIKMATVPGCRQNVWLVVRSRTVNAYYSYAINPSGLDTQAVVSYCGNNSLKDYGVVGYSSPIARSTTLTAGVLKPSNSGRFLVAGTHKGIELYDFEPCSGLLKNARMLDTIGVHGLCFSPDDSKLYSTQFDLEYDYVPRGKVYQYSFDAADIRSTLSSKKLILENPILFWPAWNDYTAGLLGDIKQGPDQKLYIANNAQFMSGEMPVLPVPPATTVFLHQGMHIIHQPNRSGMACQPEMNAITLLGSKMYSTGLLLPQDIVLPNRATPDTLKGALYNLQFCFTNEGTLLANDGYGCYLWDDGSREQHRKVTRDGTYWVSYYQDCSFRTDSFRVTFVPLPLVPELSYGCPGEGVLYIPLSGSRPVSYDYVLRDTAGLVVATTRNNRAFSFGGLAAGDYLLQISSGSCDTNLHLSIVEYPVPELVVHPVDTLIYYGDTITLQASGAYRYVWSPAAELDGASGAAVRGWPRKSTLYSIIGINEYGCSSEVFSRVRVDYGRPEFIPNAFSPNGDGINDVFRLPGLLTQTIEVFQIVDRYGQVVFSTNDLDSGWDGRFNGKACDVGTYYYLLRLRFPDGVVRGYKGDVVLIR